MTSTFPFGGGLCLDGAGAAGASAVESSGSSGASPGPAAPRSAAAEKALVFRLYELLRAADLGSLSAKGLRRTLEEETGRELSASMPLLRRHIDHFVQNLDAKETLQPLGYEQARAAARFCACCAFFAAPFLPPPAARRRLLPLYLPPAAHRPAPPACPQAAGARDGGGAAAPHRAAAV
jgi:hypothetical protein